MTTIPSNDFDGVSVLIADDEEVNSLLAQSILKHSGFDVTIVENGNEALTAARTNKFDVIILDINMPVMDGLEACTLLREMEQETVRSTPIIAMTAAYDNESFRQKCLAHGFNDYIAKPFQSKDLLAKIANHLAVTSVA